MIVLNKIAKHFASKEVLKEITLSIADGEILGLIGKNGAGKTTLLNILAGLSTATSGTCAFTRNEKVGYLPDVPAFYEYLSVGEYLSFLLANQNKQTAESTKSSLLKLSGLAEKQKISSLSRGMRQKLGIISVIAADPDIYLFDEPTSALDPSGRAELMEIIRHLKDRKKTIILSSHILTDMEKICDSVAFLADGSIKLRQPILEQKGAPHHWKVTFASPFDWPETQNEGYTFKKLDDLHVEVSFTEEQALIGKQQFFAFLQSIDHEVLTIEPYQVGLDDLFKEVCGA